MLSFVVRDLVLVSWVSFVSLVSWVSWVSFVSFVSFVSWRASDSNIAIAQDNILVHQHHGLQKCNLHTQRIANEGILRCTQDDSESGTISNTEEEQNSDGAKKIGLHLTEQPYHKSDISIISSVQASLWDD